MATSKDSTPAATKAAPSKTEPKLRRKGQGAARDKVFDSDIPYPKEAHGEDFELYGPQGPASSIPEGTEIAPYASDQEFALDESQLETLKFNAPGQNLPGTSRLYTVKGIHKDGRLVQLPFESQIQNTAGGDPEDAIGLRRYQRKGITILIDWNTLTPVYCAAWGCFASAVETTKDGGLAPIDPRFPGFCTQRHAVHTLPNKYKDSGEILNQMFGERATTSRTWSI